MTNNLDDFEQPEMPHDEPVQKKGLRHNLTNAWQSQPLFKLFVLMVVAAALVAVLVAFFSGNDNHSSAQFIRPPELNEAAGGKASPYVKHETELATQTRTEDALKNGGSALPTPIGQVGDNGETDKAKAQDEQLTELKAEVEQMNHQVAQVKQAQVQGTQAPEKFDDSLAQAMQKQMQQLMEGWTPKGIVDVTVTKVDEHAGDKNAQAANQTQQPKPKQILPAGTVSYAQLLTEANSDVPGPILAQIVSGPLAGARAVGSFQVANGTADYLVLQFNVANLKGKDYSINAIALDPDTTLGGMATEVNQRYFTRVVLPAAAGFLQGFGSALGQGNSSILENGNTTIVTQSREGIRQGAFTGLGQAAQSASSFFQNQANQTRPLVRVASGTPFGMFFITTVTDKQADPNATQLVGAGQAGYQPANQGAIGGNGYNTGYNSNPYGYNGGNLGSYPNTGGYNNNPNNVPYPNYATPNAGYGSGYTNTGLLSNGINGTIGGYPGSTTIYTNR